MKRATRDEYVVRTFHTIFIKIDHLSERERERESLMGLFLEFLISSKDMTVPVTNK